MATRAYIVGGMIFVWSLAASIAHAGSDLNPKHVRVVWSGDASHSAMVAWTTNDAQDTAAHRVFYDTMPRHGQITAYRFHDIAGRNGRYTDDDSHYHHTELRNLPSHSTIYFVVQSGDYISSEYHFVTAPADDTPFQIIVGSDSRSERDTRQSMNGLIRRITAENADVLAFAHGGDYIFDGDDWDDWEEWLNDHEETVTETGRILPIIPTRGNHEDDPHFFNQIWGFPGNGDAYFTTQIGDLAFVTLNTEISMAGTQRAWLQEELKRLNENTVWIASQYHRPAFPAVKAPSGALHHFVPFFDSYGVDIVFESDGHALKRTVPILDGARNDERGVVYVGEGGLAASMRDPDDTAWYLQPPGYAEEHHHVHLLGVKPNSLRVQVILENGELFDDFSRRRRARPALDPLPAETPNEANDGPVPSAFWSLSGCNGGNPTGRDGTMPVLAALLLSIFFATRHRHSTASSMRGSGV